MGSSSKVNYVQFLTNLTSFTKETNVANIRDEYSLDINHSWLK